MNFKKRFIIAEAGNNHEGSLKFAKKLIINAKKAGANAVKFQFIRPEFFISQNDTERYNQLKKYQFDEIKMSRLFEYSKRIKFEMFATPFDVDGAKFLNRYQKIFKISSGDNNFFDLMEVVRGFKKPTIVSLGMADKKLLKEIINFFHKKTFFKNHKNLCLMHCVTSYPADKNLINLNTIPYIKNINQNLTVGFSDHTLGTEITKMAYIVGAKIIEKHFTLSNNFSKFRDHKLSLNFINFKNLINDLNYIDTILGDNTKQVNKEEHKNIKIVRRKIFLGKNLLKGSKLMKKNLLFLRSKEKGLSIEKLNRVLNKKIVKNLSKYTILQNKYFR